jgi:hypothetical protein
MLPSAIEWLQAHLVDVTSLQYNSQVTPRAWQLFEQDGRRTQVWHPLYKEQSMFKCMLRPAFISMPAALRCSRAYHAAVHPDRRCHQPGWQLQLLEKLDPYKLEAAFGRLDVKLPDTLWMNINIRAVPKTLQGGLQPCTGSLSRFHWCSVWPCEHLGRAARAGYPNPSCAAKMFR